jgi:hypothetical protein
MCKFLYWAALNYNQQDNVEQSGNGRLAINEHQMLMFATADYIRASLDV